MLIIYYISHNYKDIFKFSASPIMNIEENVIFKIGDVVMHRSNDKQKMIVIDTEPPTKEADASDYYRLFPKTIEIKEYRCRFIDDQTNKVIMHWHLPSELVRYQEKKK